MLVGSQEDVPRSMVPPSPRVHGVMIWRASSIARLRTSASARIAARSVSVAAAA